MALQLATASTGVVRDSHYVVPTGTSTPIRTLLVEPQRTNLCLQSEDFSTWVLLNVNTVISANTAAAPDGTATADFIRANAAGPASFGVSRSVTFTADGEKCASVYLKVGNGTQNIVSIWDATASVQRHAVRVTWTAGVPSLSTLTGAGTLYPVEALANGWYRIMFSATGIVAANSNDVRLYVGTIAGGVSGDSVYAWGFQAENAVVPSSYIPTAATTVTRNADSLYWSIPALNPPREMTAYLRGVNVGAYVTQPTPARLLSIGDSNPSLDPRFALSRIAGFADTQALYDDGVTLQAANLIVGSPTALRDIVEHRGVLQTNWTPLVGFSVNGGAEITATALAPSGAAPAWANTRVVIAGMGDSDSFAFTHVCVALGNQSRAAMRTFAGVP